MVEVCNEDFIFRAKWSHRCDVSVHYRPSDQSFYGHDTRSQILSSLIKILPE